MALNRLGFALCALATVVCTLLHVGTFVTTLSPFWVLPAFFFVAGAVLCARTVQANTRYATPEGRVALVGWILLVYAVLTFVYFYKITGGASSVAIVDGQYVSMYKSHVIKTITEHEYRMFPNLWTRVMSAWIAMMAVFCSTSFKRSSRQPSRVII